MCAIRPFAELVNVVMSEERSRRKMSFQQEVKCPDCEVAMVKGFMPDKTHNGTYYTRWVPGELTFWCSFFSGLNGKGTYPVSSYRCPHCGLLRSYAVTPAQ